MTAPVSGSGSCPEWMVRVANPRVFWAFIFGFVLGMARFRGIPSPSGSIGIRELAGNRKVNLWNQCYTGKIFIFKDLCYLRSRKSFRSALYFKDLVAKSSAGET